MEEKTVKTWLDIAPAYIDFLLKFIRNPSRAFARVSGSSEISSDLTSVLLGGVALSYLLVIAGGSPELKNDPGSIATFLRTTDYQLLPIFGLAVIIACGVASHVLAKLFMAFFTALTTITRNTPNGRSDPKLGGSIEDSVNATLGFSAVFLPLATGTISALSWLPKDHWIEPVLAGMLIIVFLFVYFPLALSATHPQTTWPQAALAIGGGVTLVEGLLSLLPK